MKRIVQLEELAMLGISIYALYLLQVDWWIYIIVLFGPDISMLGYAGGNKTGAFTYNVFHHKAVAIAVFLASFVTELYWLEVSGIILFGHSSLDRVAGYGLKYSSGFKFTHFGQIGNQNASSNNEVE